MNDDERLDIISHSLIMSRGISKTTLGKYIIKSEEMNQKVFKKYCGLLDFEGLEYD